MVQISEFQEYIVKAEPSVPPRTKAAALAILTVNIFRKGRSAWIFLLVNESKWSIRILHFVPG